MKINRRLATGRNRLLWGSAFSLVAVVLLAIAPVFQVMHFSSCPHHHHSLGVCHDSACDHSHIAHPIKPFGSADTNLWGSHGHAPDHCPICQALQTLGKHFSLPGQAAYPLQVAVFVIASPWQHNTLLSSFKSSIQPRAPPLI